MADAQPPEPQVPDSAQADDYAALSTHELVKRVIACDMDCPLALAEAVVARGSDAVPALCRLVADADWWSSDSAAVIHAMQLLGGIGDATAVYALLAPLERSEDDDWITEDMPGILARLGPAALPALCDFVDDDFQDPIMRSVVYDGLVGMAALGPELTEQVKGVAQELALRCLAKGELFPAAIGLSLAGFRDPIDRDILERVWRGGLWDDEDFCDWDDVMEVFEKGPYEAHSEYCIRDPMAYFAPDEQARLRQLWLEEEDRERQAREAEERKRDPMMEFSRPAPPPAQVGRNQPCPCGSGKKYKLCCGKS